MLLEKLEKSLLKLLMESTTYLHRGEKARNMVVKVQKDKNQNVNEFL